MPILVGEKTGQSEGFRNAPCRAGTCRRVLLRTWGARVSGTAGNKNNDMAGLQFPYAVVLFYFRRDLRDLPREGEVWGCAGLCREESETPVGTLPLLGYRGCHPGDGVAPFHGRWGWEVHFKRHPPRPEQPPPVVSAESILYVPRDGRDTENYKKKKSMVGFAHRCCCFCASL